MVLYSKNEIKKQEHKLFYLQAICLEREDDGSSANFLLSPFKMMAAMFNYILGQIAWTIIRFEIHHLWNPDWTYAFPQGLGEVETDQYVIYQFFFFISQIHEIVSPISNSESTIFLMNIYFDLIVLDQQEVCFLFQLLKQRKIDEKN